MKTVIFNLAGKEYGISINQVREVIRLRKIVPIPDAAVFVEGVISLRGKVVAVINLRKKMGLEKKEIDKSNRIIITHLEARPVGMIVDNVSEVTDIADENITNPDEALKQAGYLTSIAKINNRIILIVDVAKLLSSEEKAGIGIVSEKVEVRKRDG